MILIFAASLMSGPQDSAPWSAAYPVRSSSAQIIALLRDGVRDSATLTRLVATLDMTDGIVYIEPGTCRRGADRLPACLVNEIVAGGGRRYLRILVNVKKDRVDLTGSLGHELQHAVEVLTESSVTSTASLLAFYQGDGRSGARSFETAAAVDTGLAVAREIRASRKKAASFQSSNHQLQAREAEWRAASRLGWIVP